MVVAKKSNAQIVQRKLPTRVPACIAASAAPMALAPADSGGATSDCDLGKAVASTDLVISSICLNCGGLPKRVRTRRDQFNRSDPLDPVATAPRSDAAKRGPASAFQITD